MSGKSGGMTGVHCDMEEGEEKEEELAKEKDPPLLKAYMGHMGDDVRVFFLERKRLFLCNYRHTWEKVSISPVKCKCAK